MTVTLFYLILAAILFALGVFGVLIRRNLLVVFMCLELMLNAVNLSFVVLSREFGDPEGLTAVFFVFAVAAAEAAVGLSLITCVFRNYHSLEADDLQELKG